MKGVKFMPKIYNNFDQVSGGKMETEYQAKRKNPTYHVFDDITGQPIKAFKNYGAACEFDRNWNSKR